MRKLILIILLFQSVSILLAQKSEDLFTPKEVRKAYEKKTRSLDGSPGVNYYQNQTDYKIVAEFIPTERRVNGSETITYTNNSPDTLKQITMKLYQDLFKKGVARDWDLGTDDLHDGVEIKRITVNGETIDLDTKIRHNSTLMYIFLDKVILPKSKNTIEIEWSLIISAKRNVRMGTYGETNFMLGYWYPKMAVYDDIDGWQFIPHTGSCEYYNEFGNFEVEMTVPSDYTIWSSGLLQNAQEIYTDEFLKKIEEASKSDEIVHVITKEDREKGEITQKADKHTWKFKIDNMPDFAMAISNKYLWDGTSLKVGDKRIIVNAVYKFDSKDFHEVAEISRYCVNYFSTVTPAIAYPYPQLTVFNGGGGMEFPGMVNDGDGRTRNGTLHVTSHEIGHSYFPFFVGTNEQKYAWVDEGLISFFPREIVGKLTDEENYGPFNDLVKGYNLMAGSFYEVPLMITSTNTGESYRYHAYTRSAIAFYQLRELIGNDKFNAALQEYVRLWNGKHPIPFDFFFTFNKVVGEDLAWFWKPWFYELGSPDLAIGEFKNGKLTIENKGKFPVPINLKITYSDNSVKEIKLKANVWKTGNPNYLIEIPKGKVKEFNLDSEITPDAYPGNNKKTFE